MKNKVMWIISVIPLLVTLVVIKFLPESLPAHYDMNGNIDRWGSKYEQLLLPVTIILLTLFWQLFINHFRKKAEKTDDEKIKAEAISNAKLLNVVAIGMAILHGVMHFFFMYAACIEASGNMNKSPFDFNSVIAIMLGVFFIIIGNYLPKAKKNNIVGVRTPHTMDSEYVWKKSNRFAGILFVIAGIVGVIVGLLYEGFIVTGVVVALVFAVGIASVAYAALIKEPENKNR